MCFALGGEHSTLRRLLENNKDEVKLIMDIVRMDSNYVLLIKTTLDKFNLTYIPKAHNHLKVAKSLVIVGRNSGHFIVL